MSPHEDDALKKLLRQVARNKGFMPLTPEQAQAEYDTAAREQISNNEIDLIIRRVVAGQPRDRFRFLPLGHAGADSAVNDEMLVLNRNAGALDPEIARRLEELRKHALEEDDDHHEEDEPRLEG